MSQSTGAQGVRDGQATGRSGSSDAIRVCHFLNSLGDGGVQNLLLHVAELQDGADVDHSICYLREFETSIDAEFRAVDVPTTNVGRDTPFDPRSALSLARHVERADVDVIHAHLPLQQVFGRIAGRLTDTAVVSTHHNLGDNTHPAVIAAEKATRPLDDVTVAVSDAVRKRYVGGWSPEGDDQWQVVHNGIDVRSFHDRVQTRTLDEDASDAGDDGVTFVHVGRYIPGKAQVDLIHAMAAVVREYPSFQLYLVGWGDLEDDLVALTTRLGLTANVTVTGYQHDVTSYYARANAFVTSSLSEGFPITFIEAMASELPIVTTAFEGASDIVQDGKSGIVVPTRDRSGLATAMKRLHSVSERQRMGSNGYERARQQFDVERTHDAYRRIYRACTD